VPFFALSTAEEAVFAGLPLDRLRSYTDWPTIEALNQAFSSEADVQFELQKKSRYRQKLLNAEQDYNGRITREGRVPTRAHNLHDLMNVLVWAAFPQSKRRIHQLQYEELQKQLATGSTVRSAVRDRLSMIDEGGVLLHGERAYVFGHAVLEQVWSHRPWPRVSLLVVAARSSADVDLAQSLERPPAEKLPSVDLSSLFPFGA
jgi:Protein of unknown function (DUF3025)